MDPDKLARLLRQIEMEARREEVLALCRQSEKSKAPAPASHNTQKA